MHPPNLIPKEEFLEKYYFSNEVFNSTLLKWDDLEAIYLDYTSDMANMDESIQPTIKSLMKIKNIHSVRYRIKDPEHVIRKIIDKKIENPKLEIGISNYKEMLTDLIGLRALHLFKEDAYSICLAIKGELGEPHETPVVYHGLGDSEKYREEFKSSGYKIICHQNRYRSIHHVIQTPSPNPKKIYFTEIQIRTIFEEGCGEIDHLYNYPLRAKDTLLIDSIHTLNKLAGASDEMGTFIRGLDQELKNKRTNEKTIDNLTKEVQVNVKELNKCEGMLTQLESLRETTVNTWSQSSALATCGYNSRPDWLFENGSYSSNKRHGDVCCTNPDCPKCHDRACCGVNNCEVCKHIEGFCDSPDCTLCN